MKKSVKIVVCMLVVVAIAGIAIPAKAESWNIDYAKGAPSSVSNQYVYKAYEGHDDSNVYVACTSLSEGKVELITSGFSPNVTAMFTKPGSVTLSDPSPIRITIELWARSDRVIASGYILW